MVNIEARMMEHERRFRLLFRIDGRSVDIYDSLSIGRNVKKKRETEREMILIRLLGISNFKLFFLLEN